MKVIYILTCILYISNAFGLDCNKVFKSYNEAKVFIKNSDFKIEDYTDCSQSSWIRSARFYSCDGLTGYFVFTTDSKEYIHEKMPISIWKQFKAAPSKGSYYNANIKHKYRLVPRNL